MNNYQPTAEQLEKAKQLREASSNKAQEDTDKKMKEMKNDAQ